MIVIGLTGGIATGKGVVARAWSELPDVVVVDADRVTHALYAPGAPVYERIVDAFGTDILDAAGRIDRKALGRCIYDDQGARARLNAIVHPAVRARYRALAAEAGDNGAAAFVVEAALLLDSEPDREFFDAFVVTDVDEAEQLRRLMHRDGVDRAEALKKIRSQLPQAERRRRADCVLDTSGTVAETRARARALLETLRARFA